MALVYTNIQHDFRKYHGLTCNEYVLADMIYFLSTRPESRVTGWCYMTKVVMGEELGVSKQSILNLLKSLIEKGFIHKDEDTTFLRTTEKWNNVYFTNGKESLPELGKDALTGQKTKFTADGKESLPYNNTYNTSGNNSTPLPDGKGENDPVSVPKNKSKSKTKKSVETGGARQKVKCTFSQQAKFTDIYHVWHLEREGFAPNYTGANGDAAKRVINYLMTETKRRLLAEGRELSEIDAENEMLKGWALVLSRWGTMDHFHQQKIKMTEIHGSITNILKQIKDASKKTTGNGGGAAGVVGAVANRFKNGQ